MRTLDPHRDCAPTTDSCCDDWRCVGGHGASTMATTVRRVVASFSSLYRSHCHYPAHASQRGVWTYAHQWVSASGRCRRWMCQSATKGLLLTQSPQLLCAGMGRSLCPLRSLWAMLGAASPAGRRSATSASSATPIDVGRMIVRCRHVGVLLRVISKWDARMVDGTHL